MLAWLFQQIEAEIAVVLGAPGLFLASVLLVSVLVWGLLHWQCGVRLALRDEQIADLRQLLSQSFPRPETKSSAPRRLTADEIPDLLTRLPEHRPIRMVVVQGDMEAKDYAAEIENALLANGRTIESKLAGFWRTTRSGLHIAAENGVNVVTVGARE